ncbi:NUDIX domain-containing protein [Annulohypoxylon maeteangense]|uniref:NUDIX domain-containing protein n=1 Tax=Annulohypoxylon maeteangense TaxID=1927788 RepID=UPI0020087C81|nr:NUDIX domain-containing protein [Annulohypoxylon maeteangense]KAI0882760.1 NUDIX domain-containing protein [Annulohypoxylon maeteangense]
MASPPKTYLDLIKACDNFPYINIPQTPIAESPNPIFYQLLLPSDPRPHGFMHPATVAAMPWTSHFAISAPEARPRTVQVLDPTNGADPRGSCNAAFAAVVQRAKDLDVFESLSKRKSTEDYRIVGAKYPTVQLRRAAAPLFGIACLGVHLTMYVREGDGEFRIWVPRRSRKMNTYPGKLDSTIAGGVAAHESPLECLVHEAAEEASLPESLIRERARACGAITYVGTSDTGPEAGLTASGVLYVYDMEVDETVVPKPMDDEVEEFYLWDVRQVKEALLRDEFKTNCASVMIDFFVRHGIITEENEPDYLEITTRLHRSLPVPLTSSA